jgi:hypothetical protein
VLLPEVRGRLDRNSTRPEDADYLWLDFGADGWQPRYPQRSAESSTS